MPQDIDAIAARHVDVEDQQVEAILPQLFKRLFAARSFLDVRNVAVFEQVLPQSGADYGVIINQ